MLHLRLVCPAELTQGVLATLDRNASVVNVIVLPGAARSPKGDVVLCDVAREDASVVIEDLRELGLPDSGSIALEQVDTAISKVADEAVRHARGSAADAVVWEEVEGSTAENVELSGAFLAFMALAAIIATIGIYQDSPILIVGAMVVGPEFGPLAGLCVALVQRRRRLAARSALALGVGFPLAIGATFVATLAARATGLMSADFDQANHTIANVIASPDAFAAIVATCAGAAGVLSLSTAKSGALIGVLISVTTLPAAANVGFSAAYRDWVSWRGSLEQLGLNLACILLAGTTVLGVQRALYARRRRLHRHEAS